MKKMMLASFLLAGIMSVHAQLSTSTGGATSVLPNSPTTNTNVGIGIANPKYKLDILTPVTGTETETCSGIRLQSDSFGYIIEGGIKQKAGAILKFSLNAGGTISEKLRIDQNGNLGIGTTDPTAKLEVAGNTKINGNLSFSNYGGGFFMQDNDWIRTFGNKNFYHNTGIMRTDGVFHVGSNGNRLVVNANGNVGIGTMTPNDKLEISGAINIQGTNSGNTVPALGTNSGRFKLLNANTYGVIADVLTSGDTYFQSKRVDGTAVAYNLLFNPLGGNVGIGTATPTSKLDVRGIISTPEIAFRNADGGDDSDPYRLRKVQGSPNNNWLELQLNDDPNESFRIYGNSCAGFGCGEYSSNLYHSFDAQGNVFHSGNVGIGTQKPDQKLTVKGKIHAEEIIVDLKVPADYVFQKYYTGTSALKSDYVMPTLAEIESFTKKNHHLPNVPSAATIQENGLSLGEMSNKLLQKIEELTLYAIEQNKKLEEQQKNIAEQHNVVKEQNKVIEELKVQVATLINKKE